MGHCIYILRKEQLVFVRNSFLIESQPFYIYGTFSWKTFSVENPILCLGTEDTKKFHPFQQSRSLVGHLEETTCRPLAIKKQTSPAMDAEPSIYCLATKAAKLLWKSIMYLQCSVPVAAGASYEQCVTILLLPENTDYWMHLSLLYLDMAQNFLYTFFFSAKWSCQPWPLTLVLS